MNGIDLRIPYPRFDWEGNNYLKTRANIWNLSTIAWKLETTCEQKEEEKIPLRGAKTTNAGPATRTHPGHPCNDDLCLNRARMRLASLLPNLYSLLVWPCFLCQVCAVCSESYKHDGCLGLVFACELGEVKKGAGWEWRLEALLCDVVGKGTVAAEGQTDSTEGKSLNIHQENDPEAIHRVCRARVTSLVLTQGETSIELQVGREEAG